MRGDIELLSLITICTLLRPTIVYKLVTYMLCFASLFWAMLHNYGKNIKFFDIDIDIELNKVDLLIHPKINKYITNKFGKDFSLLDIFHLSYSALELLA